MQSNEERYRQAVEASAPPLPKSPRPIVILGAGGIIRDAHLPAYKKAGFPVVAIADPAPGKAEDLAKERAIPRAFDSIQQAMGETLEEATAIRNHCRQHGLTAAVNFQLRYSPNNLGAVALHKAGLLGDLHDMEVQVRTYMPWQLWTFLATAPRLEILYHSIHYLDLIRSWLGNPLGVYAKTVRNPQGRALA